MTPWHAVPRSLLYEAVKNLGPRQLIHLLFVAVIAGTVAIAHGTTASSVAEQARAHERSGGLVWTAYPRTTGGISAKNCDAMRSVTGVEGAGGPMANTDTVATLPGGGHVDVAVVTPQALEVWQVEAPAHGVVVGSDLAELDVVGREVGLQRSAQPRSAAVTVSSVTAELPATVPVDQLRSSVVVTAAATGLVSECWIRTTAQAYEAMPDAIAAGFSGEHVRVAPYREWPHGVPTPAAQWHTWINGRAWLIGGALMALVSLITTLSRRPELGVYQTFGASRGQVSALLAIEAAFIAAGGFLLAGAAATSVFLIRGGERAATAISLSGMAGLATVLAGWAIGVVATWAVTGGSVAAVLRDR